MDLRNHENNLRIIGKIFIVIGLILVPISITTFFFVDMVSHRDFWMDMREFDVLLFEIRPPQNLLFFFPILQTLTSLLFLVSGYGLALEKPWSKHLAMVPAVILMFQFPIGTALGGYMIYAIHYVPQESRTEANTEA